MANNEYLKCPKCGSIMVLRERYSDGKCFYGCSDYPNCNGTRNLEEGNGKLVLDSFSNGNSGRCVKCDQYPAYGSLSSMGMCPSCQEEFDEE